MAHIPFHPHPATGKIPHLHMDLGLLGAEIGAAAQVGCLVLPLDRVVGLAAIHPAAVDADAHDAQALPGAHCDL